MTRVGVEPGSTEQFELEESQRFPGTTRSVWVHRPAGHRADEPSAVMFFNDGWWYLDPDGDVRGGIVLDNLAANRDLPQMIGVFVDPGVLDVNGTPKKHRNAEYDAFNDAYASFLLDEVLPVVRERYVVSDDPMMRGICGGSSGGNAASPRRGVDPRAWAERSPSIRASCRCPVATRTRPFLLPNRAGRHVCSSTPLTAICTGTSVSGIGSPRAWTPRPHSRARATTFASLSATAAIHPTTAEYFSPTLSAGSGKLTPRPFDSRLACGIARTKRAFKLSSVPCERKGSVGCLDGKSR
ncbi:putative esterase [Curtobacterium sp. PhB128]|nr:putative esterase [Curtobacterium sp. PhB128]TCL99152.1 putative esterase [Curtobacterium sp. PhB138]TCU84276.1 putative esterase [Curtobacterium sp. PhB191]